MLRRFAVCLSLLLPGALAAQEGSIAYTHTVKLDFEIPEELRARIEARGGGRGIEQMFPTDRTSEVVLIFNATQALMKPVPRDAPEGRGERGAFGGRGRDAAPLGAERRRALGARFRMGATTREAQETIVEAHTDFDEGTVIEAREFLGRTFLIEDQRPAYEWKLTTEQAEFLGYMVIKATTVHDSSTVEAWFTPEIPISGGPATFGGLPGMILVVTVDDGATSYTASAVSLTAVEEGVIQRPTEGDEVTREGYEQIVADKLEELRATRGRIR